MTWIIKENSTEYTIMIPAAARDALSENLDALAATYEPNARMVWLGIPRLEAGHVFTFGVSYTYSDQERGFLETTKLFYREATEKTRTHPAYPHQMNVSVENVDLIGQKSSLYTEQDAAKIEPARRIANLALPAGVVYAFERVNDAPKAG